MNQMHNTHKTCLLLLVGMLHVFFPPVLLWCESQGNGAEPKLQATLDTGSAKLGSIVTLTLNYDLPDGTQLPEPIAIKGLGGLTVVEQTVAPGTVKIRLLVDKLDVLKTDSISLPYMDKEGHTQILMADPVSVEVLSNLGEKPEEAQLKPIQKIIPTTALWLKYLPWAAGIMGVIVLLAAVYWWYHNKRIQTLFPEIMDPPHVQAKKELETLLSQNLFEKGEVKRFYFGFSEILRRYLEALRGFPAAELTTEEIALHMHNEKDRVLMPLLRGADLVKFADAVPIPAKKDDEVQRAFAYIRETTPSPENTLPAPNNKPPRRPRP
jgi:hypothetical protein